MKKGVFIGSALLFLLIAGIAFASAKDVGYILINKNNANKEIISVFNQMNLSYDLIADSSIKSQNLSKYRFLFFDDVRLNNARKLPIYSFPSIIMNKYYGYDWGLTDRDGISQLTSTSPLRVSIAGGGIEQVYDQTRASLTGGYIPYYYLDDKNKANFNGIARTYTGDGEFGDVVANMPAGTALKNNKKSKAKICFFGIAKTNYWTDSARDLFGDCVSYVSSVCSSDNDCPAETFGGRYCIGNNVFKNLKKFTCVNGGQANSACAENVTPVNVENCTDLCVNGECRQIACIKNSDCGDDVFTGNKFCSGNSVMRNFTSWSCINPGQENAACVSDISKKEIEYCASPDPCFNGECVLIICHNDSECDDRDSGTEDKCIFAGTPMSRCENTRIACFKNSDCGTNSVSDKLCSGKDVVKSFVNYTCSNPGTINSVCSNVTGNINIETCAKKCSLGKCININCTSDSECDDGSARTFDSCVNAGLETSFCRNTEVNCLNNADCDFSGFVGNEFCYTNNVFKYYKNATCINPGTLQSSCSVEQFPSKIQDCNDNNALTVDSCVDNGTSTAYCNHEVINCMNDSFCNDGNVRTEDKCVNQGTTISRCEHYNITCLNNADCGIDGFTGNKFCSGNNLFRNFTRFTCADAGTRNSRCANSIEPRLNQTCAFGCSDGVCKVGVHDVGLIDFEDSVNGIKITDSADNPLLASTSELMKNQKYKIYFNVINKGDFTESVSFKGVSCVSWTPGATDLLVGESKTKYNTINFTCNPGFYNITLTANLSSDSNPADNTRTRSIRIIECKTNPDCGLVVSRRGCSGSSVVDNVTTPVCTDGMCSSLVNTTLIENCPAGCSNGSCIIRCRNNSDCNDNRNRTEDICINQGAINSKCENKDITCFNDSECGVEGFTGSPFCSGKNIQQKFADYTCTNNGTSLSSCSVENSDREIGTCLFGCSNEGGCTC